MLEMAELMGQHASDFVGVLGLRQQSIEQIDLAARIESTQLGEIDPEEYAALLAEIEGMSDEEARQLLATEDSPT